MFQSAPLAEARGDTLAVWRPKYTTCFNPLPLPKQGEIPWRCGVRSTRPVSIRSPCRSKGRYPGGVASEVHDLFQSAPLAEARGDANEVYFSVRKSIEFQSAPLAEARGDVACRAPRDRFTRFNPLPLPKQGEICTRKDASCRESRVSIRSPCRSKGRSEKMFGSARQYSLVSIRSPCRSKGRCRGTRRRTRVAQCFNPLPLPKQGEMPHACPRVQTHTRFNPLPLPKQGEIPHVLGAVQCFPGVSIRSPCRSKGRCDGECCDLCLRDVSIRSPCRSKGRYTETIEAAIWKACFNPLPLPKQGEMAMLRETEASLPSFNPLPLPKQGEISAAVAARTKST